MQRELDRATYVQNRGQLFDALKAQYGEFDVPEAYVASEIKRLAQNFENQMRMYGMKKLPDSFKPAEMFKDEAVKEARLGVIVRQIMTELDCTKPNPEYVDAQLKQISSAYEDADEVIAQLRKDKEQFANVENAAIEAEVVDKILAKACDGEEKKAFDELVGRQ